MHKQTYPHGHRIPMLMVVEPQDIEFLVKESEVLTGQAGRIFVIAGADWLSYRVLWSQAGFKVERLDDKGQVLHTQYQLPWEFAEHSVIEALQAGQLFTPSVRPRGCPPPPGGHVTNTEFIMNNPEYEARIDDVKRRAHGRWTEILGSLGVSEQILKKRNQPCPLCGGTDRFQYTDKFGEGNYHCRACGAGGGFKLLQAVTGLDFNTALKEVERVVGTSPAAQHEASPEPSAERMKALAKRLWEEAMPVTPGDEVDRYLSGRRLALAHYPKVLRLHPALGYYEKDPTSGKSRKVAEYAAMLACIQGADGHAVTLHRTYLKDGRKANVSEAKKVLSSGINGAAVRLFEPEHELAIAEGIETAMAVHLATGKPVWAGLNAGNLEKLWLPDSVQSICIYADNDAHADFDGQMFAFALARRLKKQERQSGPRQVRVLLPKTPGTDWADVWLAKAEHTAQTA